MRPHLAAAQTRRADLPEVQVRTLGYAERGEEAVKQGFRNLAARQIQAESDFLDVLQRNGWLDRESAELVLAYYRKHKLVKMDAVNGTMTVKHGAFLDTDTIRRCAEIVACEA